MNRRFIRIAENNRKTMELVFKQQLIATVSDVIQLYEDLVGLIADVKVKEDTLALAQRLYEDNHVQVDQGTLAPVELTRAQAGVAAARQDLANSQGYELQQELILKTVLTRRGTGDRAIRDVRVIPTTPLETPEKEPVRDIDDLLAQAFHNRPELEEARLQSGIITSLWRGRATSCCRNWTWWAPAKLRARGPAQSASHGAFHHRHAGHIVGFNRGTIVDWRPGHRPKSDFHLPLPNLCRRSATDSAFEKSRGSGGRRAG